VKCVYGAVSGSLLKYDLVASDVVMLCLVTLSTGPPAEQVLPGDGERIQSPKRCVLNENRTMDNAQKYNICINIPTSQTFRS
jgi:hypothetical protein